MRASADIQAAMRTGEGAPDYSPIQTGSGFSLALGPLFGRREGGRLIITFKVSERHVNDTKNCHGGALATFADMQLIAACDHQPSIDGHAPTISLSIDYLAPAALGDWVECDALLVKRTRTMIFTQAIMRVGTEPIARSAAIYRSPPKSEFGPENRAGAVNSLDD